MAVETPVAVGIPRVAVAVAARVEIKVAAAPYGSGAVAPEQAKTTTQVGPVRDTLIKKGLIYAPRHGVVDFTVPMFDEFLRRWLDE